MNILKFSTVLYAQKHKVKNGERLGTFKPERSNALERIVENVHDMVLFKFQKRKNNCKIYGFNQLQFMHSKRNVSRVDDKYKLGHLKTRNLKDLSLNEYYFVTHGH